MILAKNIKQVLTLTVLFTLLISCNGKKAETNNLSVTIDPQKYFLDQLVGDRFVVNSLVAEGSNPESFDPAPAQMIALNNSRAYFKVGFLGIENSLIDKLKDDANLRIADCSTGIEIIEECHHHDHDHGHEHEQHGHAGGDPHYWSSVASAKIIIKNMLDVLVELDKDNESLYTANYNKELIKINETDSIIQSYLSKTDSKAFVIYHPALSYFARDYGLDQLSIEQEGKSPSPTQLKSLIDEALEKKVKVVFIQQEFDVKNAETIAKQIGAKTLPINLLSYNWHEEMINIAKAIAGE